MNYNGKCEDEFKIVKQETDSGERTWGSSALKLALEKGVAFPADKHPILTDIVKDELDLTCDAKIKMENVAFLNENNFIRSSGNEDGICPSFEEVIIKEERVDLDQNVNDTDVKLSGAGSASFGEEDTDEEMPRTEENLMMNADPVFNEVKIKSETAEELDSNAQTNNVFSSRDRTGPDGSDNPVEIPAKKKSRALPAKKYDWCHTCRNAFERSPESETPGACKVCGQKLRGFKGSHNGKPYACDICKRTFRSPSSLTAHTRTHTNEKPYKCEVCEKTFRVSSFLTAHMRTHSNDKPYKCEVCAKSFSTASQVTRHMPMHTNDKPYKCEVCAKSFSQPSAVTRHMRRHTKEKPYKCQICERRFNFAGSVTNHMRTHTT